MFFSHKPPSDQSELCLVATDDTVFVHQSRDVMMSTLQHFDGALAAAGIPRKKSKDTTLVEQITVLGCDVSRRPHVAEPSQNKLLRCLACCLDLLRTKSASPGAVNGLLGLLQWFSLLQRPMFGVFDQIYEFVRREPNVRKPVPCNVLREIALATSLLPLLSVSLDEGFHEELLACDAAPEFDGQQQQARASKAKPIGSAPGRLRAAARSRTVLGTLSLRFTSSLVLPEV